MVVLAISNDEMTSFPDSLLTVIFPGISGRFGRIPVVNSSASFNPSPASTFGQACHGIPRRFVISEEQ